MYFMIDQNFYCWLFHEHCSSEVFQTLQHYNLAWGVNSRFDDLDLVLRSLVCQNHKLRSVVFLVSCPPLTLTEFALHQDFHVSVDDHRYCIVIQRRRCQWHGVNVGYVNLQYAVYPHKEIGNSHTDRVGTGLDHNVQ